VVVAEAVGGGAAPRALSGFGVILGATIVSGVASYLLTWLVPRFIGVTHYTAFALFWATTYLIVGALSGIQQEVTRGTQPLAPGSAAQVSRARNFGLVAGVTVFATVLLSSPLWAGAVFGSRSAELALPLAVGAASYVMVTVLAGSLYGISQWVPIAALMIADAVLRLASVGITILFTTDIAALAWAIAAPFGLALVLLWPFVRRSIVGRTQLDVGYGELVWNVVRTIVAAASLGLMVSGFPVVLGITSQGEPVELVGLYILVATLTRAPLIVVAMSLQSYFLVTFRDRIGTFWRTFARIQGVVAAGGAVLAVAAWWLGPEVYGLLFPGEARPERWLMAALVASSALVASLCVSAPAVLALSSHLTYSAAWAVAAAVTVIALMLPIDFNTRTVVALLAGPFAGSLLTTIFLVLRLRRERAG